MMKLFSVLLIGSFLLVCLSAGCGMMDSPRERTLRFENGADLHARMLVDDLDYLLLLERTSSLTEYHAHLGR
jgi:hypothetical protein